jgi:hypothetical protein
MSGALGSPLISGDLCDVSKGYAVNFRFLLLCKDLTYTHEASKQSDVDLTNLN